MVVSECHISNLGNGDVDGSVAQMLAREVSPPEDNVAVGEASPWSVAGLGVCDENSRRELARL